MKILFLYGNKQAKVLADWLSKEGNEVVFTSDLVDKTMVEEGKFDLIVSYTYRFLLKADVLEAVKGNVVNLHISYLPWNRGSNPNPWSWVEDTPKGVTIHYMDAKLDSGDIIAQRLVTFEKEATLASSYEKLNQEIVELFQRIFSSYPFWNDMRKKAVGKGSYHNVAQFEPYKEMIGGNFDMSVIEFAERARKIRDLYEKDTV